MVTILVIHRDPVVRIAARRALEPAGFCVSEAGDISEAPPGLLDLVIADFAVTSEAVIRHRHAAARVLVIGETGVTIPFTASQLLAAVRRRLAQRR